MDTPSDIINSLTSKQRIVVFLFLTSEVVASQWSDSNYESGSLNRRSILLRGETISITLNSFDVAKIETFLKNQNEFLST